LTGLGALRSWAIRADYLEDILLMVGKPIEPWARCYIVVSILEPNPTSTLGVSLHHLEALTSLNREWFRAVSNERQRAPLLCAGSHHQHISQDRDRQRRIVGGLSCRVKRGYQDEQKLDAHICGQSPTRSPNQKITK
jgi:hypothetical protein